MATKRYNNYSDMITFSRASSGTALAKISYGPELVTNGTFDTDVSGWTTGWDAFGDELSHDASGKAKITLTSNSTGAYPRYVQAISGLTIGAVYQISWEGDGSGGAAIGLVWTGVSNGTGGETMYAQGTYYYIATAATMYVAMTLFNETTVGDFGLFDNVSVKEVLYDQADGTLQLFNHPANQPRVEYDYQGNRLGLLVEEARTNYNNDSQITSSGWTTVRSSLDTSESALFLDGTIAPRLKEDATASNTHHIQDIHTLASSSAVAVFSVFVKKPDLNSRDYVALKLIDDPAGSFKGYTVVFDASDGTFQDDGSTGSPTGTFYGSQQYPDGWVRLWLGFTKAGTATRTDAQIALSRVSTVDATGTLPNHNGDGVSGLYVCGAQVEQGSFPTSYIPTTGTTSTRSADVASINVGSFGHHPKVYTILLTAINGGVDNNSGTGNNSNSVIELNTTTTNYSSVGIGSTSSRFDRVALASRSNAGLIEEIEYQVDDSFTNGQVAKVAAIFDTRTNVITGCVDGEAIFASTGTNPIGGVELPFTQMRIEQGQGKMHISSIACYPRRLTDAQIKALTSPPETPTLSLSFDGSSTSYLETNIHG